MVNDHAHEYYDIYGLDGLINSAVDPLMEDIARLSEKVAEQASIIGDLEDEILDLRDQIGELEAEKEPR